MLIKIEHRIYLLLNIKMITSQTIDSTTNIRPQDPTTPIHSTIVCQNYHFRILTCQYQKNSYLVFYTTFTWVIYAFALSILIISQYLYSQYYPFFVTVSIAYVPLNGFAIYNKKIFGASFIISSILFNLITIAASIFLWLQLPYLGFAFGAYLTFESIFNCLIVENKGKILLKMLVFMQILIICLKMDDTVTLDWNQALFGFIIISLFLASAGSCIVIYSFLISLWSFRESYHQIKKEGLRYLALNLLTPAFVISIPIWGVYIDCSYEIPTVLALIFAIFTSFFTFLKRSEITLFLCRTIQREAKDDNTFKIQSKKIIEEKSLFQVSQNWFTEKYDKQTCENNLKLQDCVACMDSICQSVWLPCGHCTLCSKCTSHLITTQVHCPLCKSKPMQIVNICKKDVNLSCKILRKNEYEISKCLVIKKI